MSKYFCPYCNSRYKFNIKTNSDKLICSLCGEEMLRKSFINIKQTVSLIVLITFIVPLVYTFLVLVINRKQFKKDLNQNYQTELGVSINFSNT